MEGLLPLVYRAMKRNKTRRQYECLSSGAAALNYNISMVEIYPQTQGHVHQNQTLSTQKMSHHHDDKIGHRRYKSVGDFDNYGFQSPQMRTGGAATSPSSKQIVRFRSQRFFSCITGV